MRRQLARISLSLTALSVLFCGCAAPQPAGPPRESSRAPANVAQLVAEFTGQSAAQPRDDKQLEQAYAAVVDDLLPGMAAETMTGREQPQQTFERICLRAGRPGAENERAALCRALASRLASQTPKAARIWMMRKLDAIGGSECVTAVAACLADSDADIRETARRCLQWNPSDAARDALLAVLERTSEPEWQVALLNALATRRDSSTAAAFVKRASSDDEQVAAAALAGLGEIDNADATAALLQAWARGKPALRPSAGGAILRMADRLIETGRGDDAAVYYSQLLSSQEPRLVVAGLSGVARAKGEKSLPVLREAYRSGPDEKLRCIAARLAGELPGNPVTPALLEDLKGMPPAVQCVLLDCLGRRGDVSAAEPIATLLMPEARGVELEVRLAAIEALGRLADADTLTQLAIEAANAPSKFPAAEAARVRDAARAALAAFRGADIDEKLLAALNARTKDSVAAEYVRALAARRCKPAQSVFLSLANNADDTVQIAALEALGVGLAEIDAATLKRLISYPRGGAAREALENLVVSVCQKSPDRDACVRGLLPLPSNPADAITLLGILGRVQGPAALETLRAAAANRDSSDAPLTDAAVRALAEWSTTEVLPDLRRLAGEAPEEALRILALRGYVRLLRQPSDRSPSQTLDQLGDAMTMATRDDERRLVLAALGEIGDPTALLAAKMHLENPELGDEAAVAIAAIARRIAGAQPGRARAALADLADYTLGASATKAVQEASEFLDRFQGYIAHWEYAGPFVQDGKKSADLFEIAFAPEPGGSSSNPSVDWRPLTCARPDNPWIFDLTQIDKGLSRCLYVRTQVSSAREQPARLEMGSDDCIKAWLNGELVHKNLAYRGVKPGDDAVEVTLKQGENTLVLKIVQSDGGWGFCCGLRAPGGGKLEGMRLAGQ